MVQDEIFSNEKKNEMKLTFFGRFHGPGEQSLHQ